MRVGFMQDWTRHMLKVAEDSISAWAAAGSGTDHQVWRASSATRPDADPYTVVYHATRMGEFISCDCPAGRRDLKCKHCASVLIAIHPADAINALNGKPA